MNCYNEAFRWSSECRFIVRNDRILIAKNSAWMIISCECHEIINLAIKEQLSQMELLSSFDEIDDKIYFEELLGKLNQMGALQEITIDENPEKRDIYFVLTNRCNLKCTHCCVEADINSKDCLSTEEVLEIIDKIIQLKPDTITLSGGESLIRTDIYEILEYLSARFTGTVILMTNGILINRSNIMRIIPHVSNIDISIDGIDEETCAPIRGAGVYEKVLETIRLLQEFNFYKISLSMVFGSQNQEQLDTFLELNETYGTKAIPRTFAPIGRGKDVVDVYVKSSGSVTELTTSDIDIKSDLPVGGCGAISDGVAIDYTGYIYPCSLLIKDKYILGDIRTINDFGDWYFSKRYNENGHRNFLELIPEQHPQCKNCDVNLFCWGCLEVVDRFNEDAELWEKRCHRNKPYLREIVWGNV